MNNPPQISATHHNPQTQPQPPKNPATHRNPQTQPLATQNPSYNNPQTQLPTTTHKPAKKPTKLLKKSDRESVWRSSRRGVAAALETNHADEPESDEWLDGFGGLWEERT